MVGRTGSSGDGRTRSHTAISDVCSYESDPSQLQMIANSPQISSDHLSESDRISPPESCMAIGVAKSKVTDEDIPLVGAFSIATKFAITDQDIDKAID